MCLITLFNRAATHILRAFYSADIGIMNFGSPLDSVACCLMLVAGRPLSQQIIFSNQLQRSQTQTVKRNCTETSSQCIAYSGVVPEPLLTHDPSRSRFRVYFKRDCLAMKCVQGHAVDSPSCFIQVQGFESMWTGSSPSMARSKIPSSSKDTTLSGVITHIR